MNQLKVLVTRPHEQSLVLADVLIENGFCPIVAPMIKICELNEQQQTFAASQMADLDDVDGAIVVSRNAFRFANQIGRSHHLNFPANMRWYAVGDATAAEMIATGLQPILPGKHYDSDGLLNLGALQDVQGQTFILFAGVGGRRKIEDELRLRGASVTRIELYRREPLSGVACDTDKVPDVLTAMSGETVEALAGYLVDRRNSWFSKPLFVPSARAAKIAFDMQFQKVRVTETPSKKSLLEALYRYAAEV